MAEKKVFAQIDVLGSNQTPMDAFIYMEDQGGGGGGSGKDVDLTPYLEFDDPENPNPRKFKITQEGYDIIYNAWHNHEDNVYKFAVGTDFVFAAKVSKTDAFGESMFWMEGSFFKTVMTYLVTDNLDVRLVNPMDITSNIEVRIEESGPVAVLDGTVLQQIVNDFQAGNNRVYIVNSLFFGREESYDVFFKPIGYDESSKILKFETCLDKNATMYISIDENGLISLQLQVAVIGDFWTGSVPDEFPTLNMLELNGHMYKVGSGDKLYKHNIYYVAYASGMSGHSAIVQDVIYSTSMDVFSLDDYIKYVFSKQNTIDNNDVYLPKKAMVKGSSGSYKTIYEDCYLTARNLGSQTSPDYYLYINGNTMFSIDYNTIINSFRIMNAIQQNVTSNEISLLGNTSINATLDKRSNMCKFVDMVEEL